jgi:hypothetical protein
VHVKVGASVGWHVVFKSLNPAREPKCTIHSFQVLFAPLRIPHSKIVDWFIMNSYCLRIMLLTQIQSGFGDVRLQRIVSVKKKPKAIIMHALAHTSHNTGAKNQSR